MFWLTKVHANLFVFNNGIRIVYRPKCLPLLFCGDVLESVWFYGSMVKMLVKSTFMAVSGPGNWFAGRFRMSQNNCVYIWSELSIQFSVIHIMKRSHGSISSYFWSSNCRNAKKCLILIVQALLNALVDKVHANLFLHLLMEYGLCTDPSAYGWFLVEKCSNQCDFTAQWWKCFGNQLCGWFWTWYLICWSIQDVPE